MPPSPDSLIPQMEITIAQTAQTKSLQPTQPNTPLIPILPPPPPPILNRNPRPLLPKAPPRLITIPAPAPTPRPTPTPIPVIALTRRRLHISIMFILRAGTVLAFPLPPILALMIHILAAIIRTRAPRTHGRARTDLDVVCATVMALRRRGSVAVMTGRRRGNRHGSWRRLDEDGDGLGCWDREWCRCRHRIGG
jgi:hypothetical protein